MVGLRSITLMERLLRMRPISLVMILLLEKFLFLADLLILFKTIRLVFNAEGAQPSPLVTIPNPLVRNHS